jgi:DNA-directed RNA polymerase subunit beta'
MLARQPRGAAGSQDIVGGLPRVTEIFEARKPKDPAVMAEISGGRDPLRQAQGQDDHPRHLRRGHREGPPRPAPTSTCWSTPATIVQAGDPLTEGPLVPHDILRIKGEEALWAYMLDEVQNVYRAQGVTINDKHIELILSQMLRKVRSRTPATPSCSRRRSSTSSVFRRRTTRSRRMVRVTEAGGTDLRVGDLSPARRSSEANAKAEAEGKEAPRPSGRPATGRTLLLGITKAALSERVVPLRRVVPGVHQGAHRGGPPRRRGRPDRPQGERAARAPHPGGHGLPSRRPRATRTSSVSAPKTTSSRSAVSMTEAATEATSDN